MIRTFHNDHIGRAATDVATSFYRYGLLLRSLTSADVVIEPEIDCSLIQIDNYDFLGHDLLDQYYDTRNLTNRGEFDETFCPTILNSFRLIDDMKKLIREKKRLRKSIQTRI